MKLEISKIENKNFIKQLLEENGKTQIMCFSQNNSSKNTVCQNSWDTFEE